MTTARLRHRHASVHVPRAGEGQGPGRRPMCSRWALLGFAASGRSPFDGGPRASAASIMSKSRTANRTWLRSLRRPAASYAACLAKDPARRPNPGEIAAQCAAATGSAGASPASFWPDDVATVIRYQQAAVNAQVRALVAQPPGSSPVGPAGPATHPATQLAGQPGPDTHPPTQLAGQPGPDTHPPTQFAGFSQAIGFAAAPSVPIPGADTLTVGPGIRCPPRGLAAGTC